VLVTNPQQLEIHRRKPRRAEIAGVLVEDAVDDGNEAPAASIVTSPRSQGRYEPYYQRRQQGF
jgi:hypothetical protein